MYIIVSIHDHIMYVLSSSSALKEDFGTFSYCKVSVYEFNEDVFTVNVEFVV